MKKIFVLVASLFLCTLFANAQNNVIDNELQKILNQKGNDYIDVNIMLKAQMTSDDFAVLNCKSDSKEVRREIVTNELKKFAEKSQKDIMSVLQAEERSKKVTDIQNFWIANFINCKAKADVIYQLASHPDVATISYNNVMEVVSDSKETESRDTRAVTATIGEHLKRIKAEKAWELGYTGKGVIVAVLDSGVNTEHADLKDHLWNGNAQHGYNVVNPGQNPYDDRSHGTHCAGIVCGDGTSGMMTGVAPDATLMSIKLYSDGSGLTVDRLITGVQFAANNGAHILNISQGWLGATDANRNILREAFENLLAKGIVAVVAAGNDRENLATYPVPGNIRTPGDCPPPWLHPDQTTKGGVSSVVSVGAVTYNEFNVPSIAAISSQGPVEWDDYPYTPGMGLIRPDIVAPATIRSLSNTSNDGYVIKGGTSQAAPCVAGVMALMLEKNPDLSPEDLCRIVERTTTQTPAKKDNLYGSGVVDALEAVRAVTFNVDEPVLNVYDFTRTFNAGSNLDLKLTLINNGKASTNSSTTVTISENDTYTTIVNNSATYGTMGVMDLQTNHSSVFIDDVTESATFVVSFDQLIPDNYEVTFTVNIGSRTFDIVVTVYNKLVAPTLTATANGTDINLSWNETNNATSYNIYRDGAFLETTTSTSYTDIGLEYGTIYAYTVTSKRGDLESEHSLTVRVQTVDNPAKPSPTNVVANNNGVVTWENGAESKGSNIYRKDYLAGTETSIATNVNGTSYTDNTWNSLADGVYQYGVANTYAANEKIYEEGFEGSNSWTFYNEGWNNGATNWRIDTKSDLGGKTFYPGNGSKSAFFSNSLKNTNCLSYLVSPQFDFTEHNGSTVKLSFYYISPSWSGDVNTLEVMVSATNNGGWTQLWTNEKADATKWTKAEVNLSAYVGQQFYISFLNRAGAGYCTGVDNISIAIEGSSESRIVWSNNVYKNVNVFVQDGDWSNTDNWTAKRLPYENENVIIDADATITNDDIITVNSLVINEGKSLTLNDGTTLTVNGDFTNTDADAFIINDGAQVFQNNDDVAATFNMNIVTPGEWSESNKTGWQFIASPLKNAKIQDFIPTSSDYDLFKYDGTKELEWLNHKDETTYEVPTAPQNLLAEAISTSTIALSWDAVAGASSYKIYSDATNFISTASNTFEVTGLTPGTEYCYSVAAVNAHGESDKSEACTKTITLAPQNLVAEATGPSSIELKWDAVTGAERYVVYKDSEVLAQFVTKTPYVVEGLTQATEYCFTVKSVNYLSALIGTESEASAPACATTDITIPSAPQNVVLVATSPYSVKLTWDPVAGADSYNIYLINGTKEVEGIQETEYIFDGLTPGMGYCYNVSAVNAKGESNQTGSNEVKTPLPTPAAPQLTATATGPATVELTWNAPAYAATYKVYNEEGLEAESISSTTYTVYDLEAGEHCFTVIAVNAEGSESGTSDPACAIVTEQEQGPIVENVIIGDGNSTSTALPIYSNCAYSISQQIYTRAEIGQTGSIKAVSFKYKSGVTSSCTRTVKVYLQRTTKAFFTSGTDWVSMTDADLVYDGNITINNTPDEWVRINLGKKFEYTGDNLVVCVYDYTGKADSEITFAADQINELKGMSYYSTLFPNPLDPFNVNKTGFYNPIKRNQILFSFDTGAPEPPQNLVVRSTDATTIHLSWDPSDGATSYEIYLGNMGGDPIEITNNTEYDVTGLMTGETYCYAVKAVNDKGKSGYSALECAEAGDVQLETIPITFILRDYWGDGWNGNKLSVSYPKLEGTFNGTYTIDETTFDPYPYNASKRYTYTFTLKIPKGCNVTLTYIKSNGANPATNENSFDVKCENGTVLASAAEGSLTGVDDVFTFVADCTPKAPNAPELAATATGLKTIALSWNKVVNATSYNVYQNDAEIATGLTTTTYNVEGLNPGTNYCFTVIAVNGVGESDASNEECARTMDAPTTPQNLVATVDGSSSIILTWNTNANAISYNIYQDSEFIKNVTEPTYVVKNLNPETKYCFTITSVNGDFESAATTPVCATTEDGKALKEIIVETGTDKNPNSEGNFYLPVYDYSAYAMSQQIYTAEELGGNIGEIGSIAFKLGNQVSSTTRQYEIYITNTSLNTFNGNSFVSVSENDKVFDGSVSISGIQDTWCTINFNNSFVYTGGNIIVTVYDKTGVALQNGFHLFYKYPTTGRSLYKQGSFAINMSNLSTGNPQSYTAQIQLVITVDLTLSAPQDLVATTESASSISLSWKPVAVATSYNVYRDSELVANVTGTTCTVQGLAASTTYCYKVTSVNELGEESEATAEVCATTKMLAPSAPTNLVATANGENSIILTWSTSATATSYNIFQGGNSVATGVTGTTYTVDELKAGTEYCFTVKAVNSGGESAASNEDCAETDEKAGSGDLVLIGEKVIGEGTTSYTSYYPINFSYGPKAFSCSQQIYTKDDIGASLNGTSLNGKYLTHISFEKCRGTANYTRSIVVYIENTTKESFTGAYDWIPVTTSPAFSGEVEFGYATGYITIELDDPIEYTGNNIIITIQDATGTNISQSSSFDRFLRYSTPVNRVIYTTTTFDLQTGLAASGYAPQGKVETYANKIKLTFAGSSAKSSAASAKMTDIKGGFDKVSAFGTSSGTELSKFETAFQQGIGYLASYETETKATFKGTLNHEKSYTFNLAAYDDSKNLANFNLLGNPFSFNMNWDNTTASGLVNGYAVVNEQGGYEYLTSGEIKVGDGFFVKATGANPSLTYNTRGNRNHEKASSLNVISSSKAGDDNVIINLAGEQEGFPKIKNFNENIAVVYVTEDDMAYGIYNCNEDALEVELAFKVSNMGEYNIHIEPNGYFDYVTLVDLSNGSETNMLTSSYSFTAVPKENGKRFVLKFAKSEMPEGQDNFVYQSGKELIVETEGTVQIIDIMGRVIYSNEVTNDNNRIDISGLHSAAYIVRLINNDSVKTQKVVVY